MLCTECELFRFPYLAKPVSKSTSATEAPSLPPVTSAGNVERTPSTTSSTPVQGDNYSISAEKSVPERKLVINEVLFFVHNAYDCQARSVIHKTIVDFYQEEEIITAKTTLCQYAELSQGAPIHPYTKKHFRTYG